MSLQAFKLKLVTEAIGIVLTEALGDPDHFFRRLKPLLWSSWMNDFRIEIT